jgi:hypothetical protein
MSETNTQQVSQQTPGEETQPVLAYRVGELEKASREGFKSLADKLESISSTFATHGDVENAKNQAEMEHKAIYVEIEDVRKDVLSLKKRTWVQNTLSQYSVLF